jgi:putative nucleotidyltransferase with HDIG domain
MTTHIAAAVQPCAYRDGRRQTVHAPQRLWMFVLAVSGCGAMALACAGAALPAAPLNGWVLLLALLTFASTRFAIKVPGRPASVSVSEIFVFTSILLFGPAPATLTVAADGLWISLTHRNRRLYRTLFNVAEPAISTFAAARVFFALAGGPPLSQPHTAGPSLVLPVMAMTATYFLLNSVLQAAAVALENGGTTFEVWAQHALSLGINFYAAASLATLAVGHAAGLNLEVVGLVMPVLLLSYVAYKAVASRVEDANRHVADVEHLYHATIETLAIAVDAKDQVTHGHIRRVQRHTVAMARVLGMTDPIELKALEAASLLHDVGKLAVPDYVLNKPGALSRAEFDRIKLHAVKGAEILTAVEFPYPVVPTVRHHHEQWNGQGYPDGLSGEAIPLGARILTVVDCFDAVTSDRPYRRKLTDEEGIAILEARRGTMYDPRIVDAFIELVPELRRDDRRAEPTGGQAVADLTDLVASRRDAAGRPAVPDAIDETVSYVMAGATLTARIAEAMPSAEACLFVPAADGSVLTVAYATPLVADAVAALRIRVGEGLAGWVAANRHTIVNSDPGLDLGDAALHLGLRACTATPVFALGDLVGVLAVYLPQPRPFSEPEVRWIGRLAQELALHLTGPDRDFISGGSAVRAAAVCGWPAEIAAVLGPARAPCLSDHSALVRVRPFD